MKKLEIVIRPESLENLELLLEEQKANGMMITNILGYGNQKGYRQMYRGAKSEAKKLPKVKVETVEEGYSGWKMHLDGMTMTLRRKDGVEYLIETDQNKLREELMFRSDISIHRVSDHFFVYTETGKDVGRPELVDLAHEVRVDDTEQVTVIMVSKKGDAATRFQCVAEITVGDVRLLLPCVYLRPIEPKKELRVMEVVLSAEEAFVPPEAVQFVSSFRYDASREGDVVVVDARRRLKQYVTYAKATGREGEICLTS